MVDRNAKFGLGQRRGLAFVVLGVVITVGILILDRLHHMDPSIRAGQLGAGVGFVLIGILMLLLGRNDRRKPINSAPE